MAYHGHRPDEEMFLQGNSSSDLPVLGPLRVGTGPKPASTATPVSTSTPPPVPQAARPTANSPPYPDDTRPSQSKYRRDSITDPYSVSPRPKFSANDPNRPTVAGYAHAPTLVAQRSDSSSPASHSSSRHHRESTDGLFQVPIQKPNGRKAPQTNPYPEYHQQYFPPPTTIEQTNSRMISRTNTPQAAYHLDLSDPTASIMTTRATRGSPPPPETPVVSASSNSIEDRYAAAGFVRPGSTPASTLEFAPAADPKPFSNVPGSRRADHYANQYRSSGTSPPRSSSAQNNLVQPQRTWSPSTSASGSGQPAMSVPLKSPPPGTSMTNLPPVQPHEQAIEHDLQRMNLNDEPPPSYDSVHLPGSSSSSQQYPSEKSHPTNAEGAARLHMAAEASYALHTQGHSVFHHDPRAQHMRADSSAQSSASGSAAGPLRPAVMSAPSPSPQPVAPPPLPEGWIAHVDPNSSQYYYIHLATSATQWEFPKGPTPLDPPMSPTGTFVNPITSPIAAGFVKQQLQLASPGLPIPQSATVRPDGYLGMAGLASPTAAGFTGPPPLAGLEIYKVVPSNGVYFGPYLRYANMDIERGIWLGSLLLISDAPHPPTIHIHQSVDLSPNPRQLKAQPIFSHQRWLFYRYSIDLKMEEQGVKWTYAITSHLGCTRYEFLVAGHNETSWRFIAHSGNDFAVNVTPTERNKLGGVGYMWKDILQKHVECNGFHCQLGLGDQIFADRMWKELPLLREWTGMSGKENRKNAPWTSKHEADVTHAYFHYYTSHFDQPHLREAWAQIAHVLSINHHDIFDGYGSYPDFMQQSSMFKNFGKIGIEMFLLFQHHTTLDILRMSHDDTDLFTITGNGWHFIKYLGPAVVVVGPDTRSERTMSQVMAGPTYQGLFPKIALLPSSVQHCVWMLPVPIVYPRLESMEQFASTLATGKKMANGTFNMVGKVTGSLAGIVGAKGAVGEGFSAVKKAVGKSGLMSGMLSPFGDVGILDDLRDQWSHESKDLERTYLIRTLQQIAHNRSIRMSFLSGDVNSCGAGLLHDPSEPQSHKSMYQIITSSVVNAPLASYVLRLLNSNKPLYVPQNGHKSTHAPSDTKEDMLEIFGQDVNNQPREVKKLLARRNYVACVAFDPEIVHGAFGHSTHPLGSGSQRLSLAIDFMCQADGGFAGTVKYGPVIIPRLEYGR